MPADGHGTGASGGGEGSVSLEESIDALYALPLADFTSARNDLSKRLRAAGDRASANAVKVLRKPSLTAWAVNQVVHHYPAEWTGVLRATDQIRSAHATGGALSDAIAARRSALAGAQAAAEGVLRRAGSPPGGPQSRRVSASLEALAGGADDVRPGRLVVDLEPLGFGGLAGLDLASPPARPLRRVPPSPGRREDQPGPTPREMAKAASARAAAEKARVSAEKARAAARKAQEQWEQAHASVEQLRLAHAEAERQAAQARQATDAAREAAEAARARHLDAKSAQAGLERRLKKLATETASAESNEQAAEARMSAAQALLQAHEGASPS